MAAFCYHLRQFDDETRDSATEEYNQYVSQQQNQSTIIGKLLQLYVDDNKDIYEYYFLQTKGYKRGGVEGKSILASSLNEFIPCQRNK